MQKCKVPCFPRREPRVIQPAEVAPPKNVQRYGETNIRYVGAPLKQEQWKKSTRNSNAGRSLPQPPQENIYDTVQLPPSGRSMKQVEREQYASTSTPRSQPPPAKRRQAPLKADFYISVPIFNETLDHSYRKKNEYVYVDSQDDDVSLYHQSLSRASSLKELRSGSMRRPQSARTQDSRYTQDSLVGSGKQRINGHSKKRPSSLHRHVQNDRKREGRNKLVSGSEASFNTYSSRGTYGYESETFEDARMLRRVRAGNGMFVESDDEDCR